MTGCVPRATPPHAMDRAAESASQLFPSLGLPASSVSPSGKISGMAQRVGGNSQESNSCRLKTFGFDSGGDATG